MGVNVRDLVDNKETTTTQKEETVAQETPKVTLDPELPDGYTADTRKDGLKLFYNGQEINTTPYGDIPEGTDATSVALQLAKQHQAQQLQGGAQSLMQSSMTSPENLAAKAESSPIQRHDYQTINQNMQKFGYAEGEQPQGTASTAGTSTATAAGKTDANTYTAATTQGAVQDATKGMTGAKGTVSDEAQVDPAVMSPDELAQLGLSPAQIDAYNKAVAAKREVQQGELIDGSTVDMNQVNQQTNVDAATADPSKNATVQGQLEGLMQDFEGGETPTWAAGAMRQAQAMLQARGLGASSIAGQAVVQAAMEAAVPIAQADAQTYATFELKNLSNKQEAALMSAKYRAEFLGQKFDQEFQTKVANAAKISEIANLNFSAEQQVALENARLANTVDVANLNAANAKVLSDAAALSNLDLANLNNRQQAQVLNARAFLDMDMANLNNEQQAQMFQYQSIVSSMFNDQAAINAAEQFNAASQNQVDQFFADLQTNVSKFNADQRNTVEMFNAGEENVMEQFNETMEARRLEFNGEQALIIAQANAKWRQDIATIESDQQHEANMQFAQDANSLTAQALDNIWQRERDIMSFAFSASQKELDRKHDLLMGDKAIDAQKDSDNRTALGYIAGNLLFGSGGGEGGGLF